MENHKCLDFGLQEFSWTYWQESKTGGGSHLYIKHFLRGRAWSCGSLFFDETVTVNSSWRTSLYSGYGNHSLCPPQGDVYGELTKVGDWKWTWYRNV